MSETGVLSRTVPERTLAPGAQRQRGHAPPPSSGRPPRRRLPSVRVLITAIVVVPIAAVSAALIFIATITSRSIAEQLGEEIVNSATTRVSNDVNAYLGSAMRVSVSYANRIARGDLNTTDLASWERAMFNDLASFPDVASICFSTPNGDCTWLLHAHGRLELGLVSGNERDKAIEYPATDDGKVDRNHPIRVYHYDATQRPWFQTAIASSQPIWTPIYFWFGPQGAASETGTGYTRSISSRDGKLLGVLVIDVTLSALSDHLRKLEIARNGYAFIVDNKGYLVAASDGPVNSWAGERLTPDRSESQAAQAIAELVAPNAQGTDIADSKTIKTQRVFVGDVPARAMVTEIQPYSGIHWHVVTVLPESSFLATARSLERRATLLAVGSIVVGLAVGMFLSRRLSNPLVRLSEHVAKVGGGDFESRLELGHASELRRLSDEVNRMAGGLKHRMMLEHSLAVAEEVQQSLLPPGMPSPRGLDVAGCSRYCDATGGDYYDFIDLPRADGAGKQTLIAVGDVTGHGIGAALLMATARGAVRASAGSAPSLGHIMSHVNHVLANDSRLGMFMTLCLLLIEPETRTVHWANAGHDPFFVYHPGSNTFEELHNGEVPLGIESELCYRENALQCATPGAFIIIGTDGIWEARNNQDEMFGKHRLREIIRQNSTGSAADLARAIEQTLFQFIGDAPIRDDVTFIIVRVKE
jgi:sigma-B regulation protein RsbU (phosphoserine phosphatase)